MSGDVDPGEVAQTLLQIAVSAGIPKDLEAKWCRALQHASMYIDQLVRLKAAQRILVEQAYNVGPMTMERVFKAKGLANMSDMQAVLDGVETALANPQAAKPEGAIVVTLTEREVRQLDRVVTFLQATCELFSTDFYDDVWNFRNHVLPYQPGDEHYDPAIEQVSEPDDETKDRNACDQCGGTGVQMIGYADGHSYREQPKPCWWCEGRGYRL